MKEPIKQVIVVRKDLNMRKGKIGAQCAHASNAILLDTLKQCKSLDKLSNDDPLILWLNNSFKKIVLQIEDEVLLLDLYNKVKEITRTSIITDIGLTEFKEPTITCIAIGPDYNDKLDPFIKHLKLY